MVLDSTVGELVRIDGPGIAWIRNVLQVLHTWMWGLWLGVAVLLFEPG